MIDAGFGGFILLFFSPPTTVYSFTVAVVSLLPEF